MKIKKQVGTILSNEKGFVLPLGLMFLAIIAIMGSTAVIITTTDLKVGSNYRSGKQAFYDADAGVQYVLKKLTIDLDDSSSETVDLEACPISLNYSTPSGFSFTVPDELTSLGNNQYSFLVTGHGPDNSKAVIEFVFYVEKKAIFNYGLFAEGLVDLKSSCHVYSYDSIDTPDPDSLIFPGASTGEADSGSNTEISTKMLTYIDGDLGLGADSLGQPAEWKDTGTPIVTGTENNVERINPDPMGANDSSSELYQKFIDVITTNDNGTAGDGSPLEGATEIDLGRRETLTLTAGDYYFTSIILKNGSTLEIDASSGPVNIYLSGKLEAKNGSSINNLSQPIDFAIFSNSSQDLTFKHSSDYKGMVYAPNAHLEMKNTADVYGLIWGNTIGIHCSGEFFFDEAIQDKYLSSNNYTIRVLSWKDNSIGN
ncbi:MAG: pilus assembly PilX N-terminal domain-containing protein [Deltaproteobacteria bacterium]|nr:pilus assembly PilX N-terminal domain-containing protein [Deltaproteobacteria bacterium]